MGMFGSGLSTKKYAAWANTRPASLLQMLFVNKGDEARVDHFGNVIHLSKYGQYNDPNGWEIDHINPASLGGSDHPSNLRALKCSANRSHGGSLGAAFSKLF